MILRNTSKILFDPAPTDGNGQPTPTTDPKPTLNADQQKIATALAKAEPPPPTEKSTQPKIHKSIFKAPPGELIEKGEFSAGEIGEDGSIGEEPPTKKPDVTKKEDGQQPPTKKEEPVTKKEEPTTGKKVDVIDPSKAKPFDYNGFSTEETTLLKQMSNPAREFTAKAIRELKTLQSQQPQAFYQHAEGYTLLPEYRENAKSLDYMNKELAYWKQQLIRIRRGEPWRPLQGFDEKTGNMVLGNELKATEEADIDISNAINIMLQQQGQLYQKQADFQKGWTEKVKQDDLALQQQRTERFAWNKDPKLLEEKVDIGGGQEYTVKQIRDEFKTWFAPYHRNSPLFELMTDMFAGLQIYGAKIRALESQTKQEKELREEVLRAEPSPDTVAANGSAKGVADFDMAGLPD